MAEAKKDAPAKAENWVWIYFPAVVVVVLLFLTSMYKEETIFGVPYESQNQETQSTTQSSKEFSIYSWVAGDPLKLGEPVINVKEVSVRNAPAGALVGTQKKLEVGRLMEGPLEQFGTFWWRVDYPLAPDGWVEFDSLSINVGTVRAINIVPLSYGFYRPIGYSLLILLFVMFVFYKLKLNSEQKIAKKKMELRLEQYREEPKPLSQLISEKPDAQEVAGFQTEEIVPIKIAEKNNRWKHIEELIKSYNVNDWKQAIIEADIILEEMLDKMGYDGVSIGDKLKKVERSDFITLDKAWSAHRVRNQIAHEGQNFKLSREVAERTIKEFESVFKEFYYI